MLGSNKFKDYVDQDISTSRKAVDDAVTNVVNHPFTGWRDNVEETHNFEVVEEKVKNFFLKPSKTTRDNDTATYTKFTAVMLKAHEEYTKIVKKWGIPEDEELGKSCKDRPSIMCGPQ